MTISKSLLRQITHQCQVFFASYDSLWTVNTLRKKNLEKIRFRGSKSRLLQIYHAYGNTKATLNSRVDIFPLYTPFGIFFYFFEFIHKSFLLILALADLFGLMSKITLPKIFARKSHKELPKTTTNVDR